MSKKNKKKRNNNNTKAPEAPEEITKGVSDCKLEDSEPEPGPDQAWTIERSEGCDPHLVTTRDIKPLEVVIEDKAIVTVPIAKVLDHNLLVIKTLHLGLF